MDKLPDAPSLTSRILCAGFMSLYAAVLAGAAVMAIFYAVYIGFLLKSSLRGFVGPLELMVLFQIPPFILITLMSLGAQFRKEPEKAMNRAMLFSFFTCCALFLVPTLIFPPDLKKTSDAVAAFIYVVATILPCAVFIIVYRILIKELLERSRQDNIFRGFYSLSVLEIILFPFLLFFIINLIRIIASIIRVFHVSLIETIAISLALYCVILIGAYVFSQRTIRAEGEIR